MILEPDQEAGLAGAGEALLAEPNRLSYRGEWGPL